MAEESTTEPSIMDAVNYALENNGADLPKAEESSESGHEPENETSTEGEGETSTESDGETSTESEGEETDAEAEARGAERDPVTGKFVKKTAEPEKPAKTPEELAAEEAAAKAAVAAKKADPVNDPIPKDLKQATRDRIQTLIKTTKEVSAERDKIRQDFEFMVQGVQATGATPEQYGEALSWLSLFNSGNPQQQAKALELVETVAEKLALHLGVERQVRDPLMAHADLVDAVKQNRILPQYARELARQRDAQKFRTESTQQIQTQQQQQFQQQQELENAKASLSQLEQALQGTDPNWTQHKAILVTALRPVFKSLPPNQWRGAFEQAYRDLRAQNVVPAPAAAPKVAPAVPKNQPMRAGKNPSSNGGMQKGPGSMAEAINDALAGMGQR